MVREGNIRYLNIDIVGSKWFLSSDSCRIKPSDPRRMLYMLFYGFVKTKVSYFARVEENKVNVACTEQCEPVCEPILLI